VHNYDSAPQITIFVDSVVRRDNFVTIEAVVGALPDDMIVVRSRDLLVHNHKGYITRERQEMFCCSLRMD
jgi:hypothetical protein